MQEKPLNYESITNNKGLILSWYIAISRRVLGKKYCNSLWLMGL